MGAFGKNDPEGFLKLLISKVDFRYRNFEQFESILIEHAMCWFDSAESYYEAAKVIFSNIFNKMLSMWKLVFMPE